MSHTTNDLARLVPSDLPAAAGDFHTLVDQITGRRRRRRLRQAGIAVAVAAVAGAVIAITRIPTWAPPPGQPSSDDEV
jgi:hypothetical protein